MTRPLHKWLSIIAAAILAILTASGAWLSTKPAIEALSAPATHGESVGQVVARAVAATPQLQSIRRSPSGTIKGQYFEGFTAVTVAIDPATGAATPIDAASQAPGWVQDLHRSFLLGEQGRALAGIGAGVMTLLLITGLPLLARHLGGWRRLLAPARGPLATRLHVEVGRAAMAGLFISAATGLWLSASGFGLVPEQVAMPAFPETLSGAAPLPYDRMEALAAIPLDELRQITLPRPGDTGDVVTVETARGTGYVDTGTGEMVAWEALGLLGRVSEFIYALHTGQGMWIVGLALGLCSLGGLALTLTGLVMWARQPRRRRGMRGVRAGLADTVVLVGSEGGSTWGFADTLARALKAHGHKVHIAPMNAFAPERYARAERLIVLAATFGEGAAPANAARFLDRLEAAAACRKLPVAVLGFGDSGFPEFCGFARQVADRLEALGWPRLLDLATVDRQSPQDFARWGRALGAALGIDLELVHQPARPRTHQLVLIERRDYGHEVQAPTAILRFALPRAGLWARLAGRALPDFEAGDLLCVLPEGSELPRSYSLASSRADGFVEICVRKHPGGLCSGQLHALKPGDSIVAFIRRNEAFRPAPGNAPAILIGAGAGIAPLAGFARANRKGREMLLYAGMRHPASDPLYAEELAEWQRQGRLAHAALAFSRIPARAYVQDLLRKDAERIADTIRRGGQILVCGGREMAQGVEAALAEILAPAGLSPAVLRKEGRYVRDVF